MGAPGAAVTPLMRPARPGGESASSSFWWTPPKPPLLMHSTWSPARAAATMRCTSSSIDLATTARLPIGASAWAASHERLPAWQKARSASSSAHGSCAFTEPSFMVFERGSNTARMRAAPTLRRRPSMVVRIAVG